MFKISGYLASIEMFGLLGFIALARSQEGGSLRFVPVFIALAAVGYVASLGATSLSRRATAGVAVITSLALVSSAQILGFVFFPGLAKDVAFFSWDNAFRSVMMLFIGIVGHFLLFGVLLVLRNFNTET